jgi:DNA transposition AAA+ family ATPase
MNHNYEGWKFIQTLQAKEVLFELMDSKDNGTAKMIIEETGGGKTTAVKKFLEAKPKHTYVVTVGDTYRLIDILHELMDLLGLQKWTCKMAKHICLRDIKNKLIEISNNGGRPIIIIDEAENSRVNTLKCYKELYDGVIEHCGFVLIGTEQLLEQLHKKSNGQSIPQLRRRLKAGTRFITPLNKARDFKPFFNHFIPDNSDVQDLLLTLCDNYGELKDYLDSVLRHCSRKKVELTVDVFRQFHNLPHDTNRFLSRLKRA